MAARAEAHGESGARRRADAEVVVAERLVAEHAERDRLVRLVDRDGLRGAWGRVVVPVAGLRRGDRAAPGACDRHQALEARGAVPESAEGNFEPGARAR